MLSYIARRVIALIPMLLIISVIVFLLTHLIPADPAREILGLKATPEAVAAKQHELGIDRSLPVQYWDWLSHAVRGDLGYSWFHPTESVMDSIKTRLPVTFNMAIGAMAFTILVGLPLGLIAGTRPQSLVDRIVTFGTSAGISMPDFWLAMMLVIVLAVNHHWLPSVGYSPGPFDQLLRGYVWDSSADIGEWARHLVMVWIALGIPGAASFARQLRGAIIDAMEQDYIRTARAKGLRGRVVVMKHALKNASMVPVTVLGLQFAYTLGGTVVLERIFSLTGMGVYMLNALSAKDVPVVQGVTLLVAVTFIVVNLAVDILYAYLNPKVRLG